MGEAIPSRELNLLRSYPNDVSYTHLDVYKRQLYAPVATHGHAKHRMEEH